MVSTRKSQSDADTEVSSPSTVADMMSSAVQDGAPRKRRRIGPAKSTEQTSTPRKPTKSRSSTSLETSKESLLMSSGSKRPVTAHATGEDQLPNLHSYDRTEERQKPGNVAFPVQPAGISDDSLRENDSEVIFETSVQSPRNSNTYPMPDPVKLQFWTHSLPALDNLAMQILNTIVKFPHDEVVALMTSPESEAAQNFRTVRDLFSYAKHGFSTSEPFLKARKLGFTQANHVETIRKANLATFLLSVLDGPTLSFTQLDDNFLDSFIPEKQSFETVHGDLFLQLKTQAFISSLNDQTSVSESELERLFPPDLKQCLLNRRGGSEALNTSEQGFLRKANERGKDLKQACEDQTSKASLSERYDWQTFLRNLCQYVKLGKHITAVHSEGQAPIGATQNAAGEAQQSPLDDIADKAQQAAEFAMQGAENEVNGVSSSAFELGTPAKNAGPDIRFHFEHALHPNVPGPELAFLSSMGPNMSWNGSFLNPNHIPNPAQSAPTSVLYDRARAAAAAKASPIARTPANANQRRAWSQEEEKALMAGLDRVGGPHWSQILAMFGKGGTISEVLKDRGQVHLKDKARNLKLFFLKHDIEVPYYLQSVTGELKTRAPGVAARKEAQKKQLSEVDRAHIEGVMALASGPQQRADALGTAGTTKNAGTHRTNDSIHVDPALSPMPQDPYRHAAKTFSADFIMPMAQAPNADMINGRQVERTAT